MNGLLRIPLNEKNWRSVQTMITTFLKVSLASLGRHRDLAIVKTEEVSLPRVVCHVRWGSPSPAAGQGTSASACPHLLQYLLPPNPLLPHPLSQLVSSRLEPRGLPASPILPPTPHVWPVLPPEQVLNSLPCSPSTSQAFSPRVLALSFRPCRGAGLRAGRASFPAMPGQPGHTALTTGYVSMFMSLYSRRLEAL